MGSDTKRKLYLRKSSFFVIEKYVEDVKHDEKVVTDLLQLIMKASHPEKEELRPNLFKMLKFRPKITKIKVSTVWIPEI